MATIDDLVDELFPGHSARPVPLPPKAKPPAGVGAGFDTDDTDDGAGPTAGAAGFDSDEEPARRPAPRPAHAQAPAQAVDTPPSSQPTTAAAAKGDGRPLVRAANSFDDSDDEEHVLQRRNHKDGPVPWPTRPHGLAKLCSPGTATLARCVPQRDYLRAQAALFPDQRTQRKGNPAPAILGGGCAFLRCLKCDCIVVRRPAAFFTAEQQPEPGQGGAAKALTADQMYIFVRNFYPDFGAFPAGVLRGVPGAAHEAGDTCMAYMCQCAWASVYAGEVGVRAGQGLGPQGDLPPWAEEGAAAPWRSDQVVWECSGHGTA